MRPYSPALIVVFPLIKILAPQTYLQHTPPHLLHFHSPSLRHIAMIKKHICWQPLHNQTSLEDKSVGLWREGGRKNKRMKTEGMTEGKQKRKEGKMGIEKKMGKAKMGQETEREGTASQ